MSRRPVGNVVVDSVATESCNVDAESDSASAEVSGRDRESRDEAESSKVRPIDGSQYR